MNRRFYWASCLIACRWGWQFSTPTLLCSAAIPPGPAARIICRIRSSLTYSFTTSRLDSSSPNANSGLSRSTSRFNAWVGACNCESAEELAAAREQAIEYFVKQYREMLTENLDQYIQNFDAYMAAGQEGKG